VRRQLTFAIGIIVVAVAGVVYTLVSGNEPLLGLDLQGGVSVVYEPVTPADDESLDQAVEIIRNRVDGLGVAEPEITKQGGNILVQLPGVEDEDRALELIGQTAELRFRPVLSTIDESIIAQADELLVSVDDGALEVVELADGEELQDGQVLQAAVDQASALVDQWQIDENTEVEDTIVVPLYVDTDDERVIVSRYLLGPSALEGEALETASAAFDGLRWVVLPRFKSGSPGIDDFNAIAAECFSAAETCPTGQLAFEIDDEVISAPTIQVPSYERDSISISGAFDEERARDLGIALRFGALPVELEAQATQIVSSTLGEDALEAGVIAGLIGLALVTIYLIAYYRLLGVVAILSLAISGALLWTIIAWIGETQGLALTLAGVTGLIVSIGVSVDSNVVYFEHLKEDVRNGRTVRSAVDRAFPVAYSTIVKADVASLIAAVVLYFLTVGQVRGFALFLGLATVLDLVATYFFMGPAIRVLARRTGLYTKPSRFGIPVPEGVPS
jgi:preprotein translocase subunit SecD